MTTRARQLFSKTKPRRAAENGAGVAAARSLANWNGIDRTAVAAGASAHHEGAPAGAQACISSAAPDAPAGSPRSHSGASARSPQRIGAGDAAGTAWFTDKQSARGGKTRAAPLVENGCGGGGVSLAQPTGSAAATSRALPRGAGCRKLCGISITGRRSSAHRKNGATVANDRSVPLAANGGRKVALALRKATGSALAPPQARPRGATRKRGSRCPVPQASRVERSAIPAPPSEFTGSAIRPDRERVSRKLRGTSITCRRCLLSKTGATVANDRAAVPLPEDGGRRVSLASHNPTGSAPAPPQARPRGATRNRGNRCPVPQASRVERSAIPAPASGFTDSAIRPDGEGVSSKLRGTSIACRCCPLSKTGSGAANMRAVPLAANGSRRASPASHKRTSSAPARFQPIPLGASATCNLGNRCLVSGTSGVPGRGIPGLPIEFTANATSPAFGGVTAGASGRVLTCLA